MNNLILSAEVVLPLFLCMALGYALRLAHLLDRHTTAKLNLLTFRVFLPILLFKNIYSTDLASVFNPRLILLTAIGIPALFLVLLALVPFLETDNRRRGVLVQGILRSNYIIFGLPITASIVGEELAGVASMMVIIVIPLFNILSVVALELFRAGKPNLRRMALGILKNPLILGTAAGFLALLSGIRLPAFLEKTISNLGGIATPLALVSLGAFFRFRSVRSGLRPLLIGLFGRLIAVPMVFVPIGIAMGFRGAELICLMTIFATPTAVSSFTMADQMGADSELAGQLVVFGTLLAVVTIFLWVFFFRQTALI